MRRSVPVAVVLVAGCSRGDSREAERPPSAPQVPVLADSLVLEAPGGITVWFTQAREARDSLGAPCQERALEVRRDTTRRGVGLLYTREAPTRLGTDAMRAVLYNGCRPGPAYRVDFSTLSPRRMSP